MQIHPENVSPAPPQQDVHTTPGKRTIPERNKHLTVVQVEQHHVCQMESDHIVTVQPIVQPTISEAGDKLADTQTVAEQIVQPVQTVVWVTKPTVYVNCPTGLGEIILIMTYIL